MVDKPLLELVFLTENLKLHLENRRLLRLQLALKVTFSLVSSLRMKKSLSKVYTGGQENDQKLVDKLTKTACTKTTKATGGIGFNWF